MIDFLKIWVRDIALIFVIISIIEMVLPNSNVKRYIDMIIGFLIIIVIVTPFIKLTYKDFDIDREIFKNNMEEIKPMYKNNLNLSLQQEEQIKNTYLTKIEEEIKNLVNENTNYRVEKANITIYEEEFKYGKIKNIELEIKEEGKERDQLDKLITINNIEEITIGKGKETFNTMKELDEDKEIKDIISKNYNIPKENIKIFLNPIGEGEISGKNYR